MIAASEFDLEKANGKLEPMSALERLAWGAETFGDKLAFLVSMQKTSSIILHLASRLGLQHEVLFVDTGFHFRQTLQLRDDFMRKLGTNVVTLYPDETPEQQELRFGKKLHLYVDGQPECCRLRKEDPFLNYVNKTGIRALVNGLRAADGGRRKNVRPLEADPRIGGYVLHPILEWGDKAVDDYLAQNPTPVHPLHAENYASVGCQCCTTPIGPGEDARAGRWRHLRGDDGQPTYCGINFTDGSGI